MKIILTGHRGSGKTTLSKHLKERLDIPIIKRYTDKAKKEHDGPEEYLFIDTNAFDDLVQQDKIYYGRYKSSRFGIKKDLGDSWIACLSYGEMVSFISNTENEEFIIIYTYLEKEEVKKRLLERKLSREKVDKTLEEDDSIVKRIKSLVRFDNDTIFRFALKQNKFIFIPYYTGDTQADIVALMKSVIANKSLPNYDLDFFSSSLNKLHDVFE